MANRSARTNTDKAAPAPDARREAVEQAVLGPQLAGATPVEDIAAILRDPLHCRIQSAIDTLHDGGQLQTPESVAFRLTRDAAKDQTDHLVYLQALAAPYAGLTHNALDDRLDEGLDMLASVARIEARMPLHLVAADQIAPEAVEWLWQGWLARAKLHLLAGPVGVGKTTLALSFAATVTSGGRFPDGSEVAPHDVLMWSGEDDAADSLIPRFLAAGGDPARFFVIQGRRGKRGAIEPFDPARDLVDLAVTLRGRSDPALLIVDPIVSAIAGDTDKNATTRRALGPVVALANRTGVAVLGITHFGKTGHGRDPVSRLIGSQAFGAMARLVLVTARTADGPNLLLRAKSNLGPSNDGYLYTLEQTDIGGGLKGLNIAWGDFVQGNARELLKEAEGAVALDAPQRDAAGAWLSEALAQGAVPVAELQQRAADEGYSWRTIERAKKALAVEAVQRKHQWHWLRPPGENTWRPGGLK